LIYLIENSQLVQLREQLFSEGKDEEASDLAMIIAGLRSVARTGLTGIKQM
jgi:hypothetical protein